jgi:hypothetical protein
MFTSDARRIGSSWLIYGKWVCKLIRGKSCKLYELEWKKKAREDMERLIGKKEERKKR